jgi:hypothetical protein
MSISDHTLRSRDSRTQTDVPSPLHIIKRPDSRWNQKLHSSRRYSSESVCSDASVRSAPEPFGGDVPLSVPKRRGNKSAVSTPRPIPAAITSRRRSTSIPDPLGTEDGTAVQQRQQRQSNGQDGSLSVPRRSQGSINRRVQLVPEQDANAQGYARLDYSRLRNSKSMLHLTASPCQSYSSISEEPIAPSDSCSSCDSLQERSVPGPRILVPRVVVTPETKVLDDGVNDLWAAVQLSAQVCGVDGTYRPPDDGDSRVSEPGTF